MPDEEKEQGKVEEADINAYMENAGEEAPTDDDRKAQLAKTYQEIHFQYKRLQIQKEQAERMDDTNRLALITEGFRENYLLRKDTVKELRRLGVKVEDKHVPE
jgi:hypothetical protein